MWIDRFVEFERGKRARSIKNVSLAEEHLHDHFPGFPVMPNTLILEGLAQTGGILLGQVYDFEHVVVLAKVPKMTFHSWATPGDTLTYEAVLTDARSEGGMVEVTAKIGERLVAEGEIVFAHADESSSGGVKVDQKSFVFSMRLLGVLDVGKAGDGTSAAG
jgi:3-hydroxyacyl-[acyl-carrier-protein] dehydratase